MYVFEIRRHLEPREERAARRTLERSIAGVDPLRDDDDVDAGVRKAVRELGAYRYEPPSCR